MKKYKFVGDSSGWSWKVNPVKGVTYDEGELAGMYGKSNWDAYEGKLIEDWDEGVHPDNVGCWEEVIDKPSVVEKLIELDGIFDKLLSCTNEIWEEIKNGDQVVKKEDQGEVIRLITLITGKYDTLNREFNS